MHCVDARFAERCGPVAAQAPLAAAMGVPEPRPGGWPSLLHVLAEGSPFEHARLAWRDAQGQALWCSLSAQPLRGTAPPLWV